MAATCPPPPSIEVVEDFEFRSPPFRQQSSPHSYHDGTETLSAPSAQPLPEARNPSLSLSHPHDYNFSPNTYDESSASATDRDRDDYTTEDDDDPKVSRLDGVAYNRTAASSRSSISSLPASIIVAGAVESPIPDKFVTPKKDRNRGTLEQTRLGSLDMLQSPGGGGRRGIGSGFRNPSSVRAMQMRDEALYDDDLTLHSGPRRGSPRSARDRYSTYSHRSATPNTSPSKAVRSQYHTPRSPSTSKLKSQKEFPLVLLHCNLLPPSLSLPLLQQQQLNAISISPALLQSVLPTKYWRRWKMLEDKLGGRNCEVRSRGVLISHPRSEYDLLEERLLESLELQRPRLRMGHFLGDSSVSIRGFDEEGEDDRESILLGMDEIVKRPKCPDCGTKVPQEVEMDRKWEVKVYAANGLMRSGAWAAAWGEMEKVDVEVAVWLPEEVRREIEARLQEMGIYDGVGDEGMEEDDKEKEEVISGIDGHQGLQEQERIAEQRRREIYGSPPPPNLRPTQEKIDGLFDDVDDDVIGVENELQAQENSYYGGKGEGQSRRPSRHRQQSQHLHAPPSARPPVDLQILISNYLKALAQDKRNVVIAMLGVFVLFLYASSRSTASARALSAMPPLPNAALLHAAEVVTATSTVTTTAIMTTTASLPPASMPSASRMIAECMSSSSLLSKSLEEYVTLAEMPKPTETVFQERPHHRPEEEGDLDEEQEQDQEHESEQEPSVLRQVMDSILGDEPAVEDGFSD